MIAPIREIPPKLRTMAHDDISQVSDIERRSYDFPWSHGVFRDCLLAGYHCVVIERDKLVVGYSILSVAAGEAHILNLCIDPNYRELGYGEQLLDEIMQGAALAEVREVFLEVGQLTRKRLRYTKRKDSARLRSGRLTIRPPTGGKMPRFFRKF